jgi:REP element-mobilizing transposase RayT
MGRGIRVQNPDTFYFLTNRCAQQRYLIKPDKTMNRIIRGCLAWAAHKHDVELACFVFMSNHFHIIARFPRMNRQSFMGDFQQELSRRTGFHRDGWTGRVFPYRYHCEPILDDKAFWEQFCYTLNNPVEAGLVPTAEHWDGVSSYRYHRDDKPFRGEWLNRTKLEELRLKGIDNPMKVALEEYTVDLVSPPSLEGVEASERADEIVERVESDRRGRLRADRRQLKDFKGMKAVRRTHWSDRPASPSFEPEPLCHASSKEARQQYREHLQQVTMSYKKATSKLRGGKEATFPPGTTPPGFHRTIKRSRTIQPPRGP